MFFVRMFNVIIKLLKRKKLQWLERQESYQKARSKRVAKYG